VIENPPEAGLPFDDYFRARFTSLVALLVKIEVARFDEAEDAVTAAMTAAYPLWDTIDDPDKWIWHVARLHFIKVRVRERRRLSRIKELIGRRQPRAATAQAAEDYDETFVLELLGRLPWAQRAVMAYTYDGWNPSEIAELLEKNPQTVRSSLRQARIAAMRILNQSHDESERGPRR
jgi:DNA-directed RNA polymerase specialized sigma24 family protein